jgi:hypothetical protein
LLLFLASDDQLWQYFLASASPTCF